MRKVKKLGEKMDELVKRIEKAQLFFRKVATNQYLRTFVMALLR
ncbi:hypothetical protein [Lactobacillus taiwanensis]|nr:hypothetical protein [Lactobacillus taiwanensis]